MTLITRTEYYGTAPLPRCPTYNREQRMRGEADGGAATAVVGQPVKLGPRRSGIKQTAPRLPLPRRSEDHRGSHQHHRLDIKGRKGWSGGSLAMPPDRGGLLWSTSAPAQVDCGLVAVVEAETIRSFICSRANYAIARLGSNGMRGLLRTPNLQSSSNRSPRLVKRRPTYHKTVARNHSHASCLRALRAPGNWNTRPTLTAPGE